MTEKPEILLLGHSQMERYADHLSRDRFGVVLMDESHQLREIHKAINFRAMYGHKRIGAQVKRRKRLTLKQKRRKANRAARRARKTRMSK